jgi:hypothetical protein
MSSSGAISGSGVIDNAGTYEFGTISGTLSSSGAISYTITANGIQFETVAGTVGIVNASLQGTLTDTNNHTHLLDMPPAF